MQPLKARVENGRYVIDAKAELPDGSEVYLVPANEGGEELGEAERAELLQAIDEGAEDFEKGDVEDALAFAQTLITAQR
jgi:hypothetical protein